MQNPFNVVRDFENAIAEYTGAPYCVSVTSCTMALLLAVAWHMAKLPKSIWSYPEARPEIEIPKHTYISVPMAIIHAGGHPTFRDEKWVGEYQLKPLPVWDSARWFTSGLYYALGIAEDFHFQDGMVCLSFHHSKILGDTQGGAIIHDNPEADKWLRRARFDGRTEGVAPKDDTFNHIGWHCYMSPDVAARLLLRLSVLPKHNEPLPMDDYFDLSKIELFK